MVNMQTPKMRNKKRLKETNFKKKRKEKKKKKESVVQNANTHGEEQMRVQGTIFVF